MKLLFLRTPAAVAILVLKLGVLSAQSPAPAATPQTPVPKTQAPTPDASGTVIFSRSTDENGETKTTVGSAAQQTPAMAEPTANDADRLAVTFTTLDLDVHLQTAAHQIAVRVRRNTQDIVEILHRNGLLRRRPAAGPQGRRRRVLSIPAARFPGRPSSARGASPRARAARDCSRRSPTSSARPASASWGRTPRDSSTRSTA